MKNKENFRIFLKFSDDLFLDKTSNCVKISVQDNGIGIAEDARSKIFQPFSQADTSMTRKYVIYSNVTYISDSSY